MVNSLNLETAVVALTSFTDEKSKFSFVGLKFVDGIYVSQIDSQSSTLEEFSAFISLCSVIGFSSSKLLLEYSNTQNLNSPLFWDISELAELITPELKVFPKKEAANILAETDWYIVRKADAGTAVPSAITTYRAAVRTKCAEMETAITNASDTPAIETLYAYVNTGTEENPVYERPLGEFPTLEI